jgi:hypothetical protein
MKWYIGLYGCTALLLAIGSIAGIRPLERIANIQTPDTKHIHQVYVGNPIRTQFRATAQGLSGISIARKESNTTPDPIVVHIYNENGIELTSLLVTTPTELRLSFEPQGQSQDHQFIIEIDTPTATRQYALLLPYESDETKYPESKVWQRDVEQQGSLGITEYEMPTVALIGFRWLTLPHQRPLWIGVALVCIGVFLHKKAIPKMPSSTPSPRNTLYYVGIFVSILIIYWPATHLFFYSDDVPILARVEHFKQNNLPILFTPHQYVEVDPNSRFGFSFWRPLSFALYPYLLSLLPGEPVASTYYGVNLVLFALCACVLFSIATSLLKSRPAALLAVTVWAVHSTKLGLLYWWSSAQDIIASLLAMTSIWLYLRYDSTSSKKYAIFSAITYLLGMYSKEYVIVTPLIILMVHFLIHREGIRTAFRGSMQILSYLTIAAGIFLITNTAALGDPRLPSGPEVNPTYGFASSISSIARNGLIYASATVESRLWATNAATSALEEKLNAWVGIWEAKTSGPYYPALVLVGVYIIILNIVRRDTHLRNITLFAGVWWLLFLGPILLFAFDWKIRWLTLSVFAGGLLLAVLAQKIRTPKPLMIALALALAYYGFTTARSEELTRFYREQSMYTRTAYMQLKEEESLKPNYERIMLIGITPDQETSLNAYLFRVYAKHPNADILYAEEEPTAPDPKTISINMSGIEPYYPESEK